MIGGQLNGVFDNPPTVMNQIKAGNLRPLGVAATQRLAQLPDVPTFAEGGMPGFEASSWFGMVAPARTPQPIVARLADEIANVLALPEVQSRFAASGARLVGNRPDAFGAFIKLESSKWSGIIRSANIRIE